ncbi:MAG TPA: PhzF family phenazine biosynthesis protein [Acidimicrobiia bacterium]|nr:PhzF family phenazine biosynthesis protein [Acidimicrobiia bacterium]
MTSRRFRLVDVFGERQLTGNGLAVVVDSDGLDTDEMLEITRWLGFSETTFLAEPETAGADYKTRIFTLAGELPFAGHPTLGTCHVWLTETGADSDEIVQECGVGLVPVRRNDEILSFRAPQLIRGGPVSDDDLVDFASILGVDAEEIVDSAWVDNGPGWVGIMLSDAGSVLRLRPDFNRSDRDPIDIGVVGLHAEGSSIAYEVRAFFSDQNGGMLEDPVTGSLNASLAQWLVGSGVVQPPYVAAQGTALGRSGRVCITQDDGEIWVGGRVFDVVEGELAEGQP